MRTTESQSSYIQPIKNQFVFTKQESNISSPRFQFSPRANMTRKKSTESLHIAHNDTKRKLFSPNIFKNSHNKEGKILASPNSKQIQKTPKMTADKNFGSSPGIKRDISSFNFSSNLRHTIDSVSDEYKNKSPSKQKRTSLQSDKIIGDNIKISHQNTILKLQNQRLKGIIHKLIDEQSLLDSKCDLQVSLKRIKTPTKFFSNNNSNYTKKLQESYQRQAVETTVTLARTIKQIFDQLKQTDTSIHHSMQHNFKESVMTLPNQLLEIKRMISQLIKQLIFLRPLVEEIQKNKEQIIYYQSKIQSDKSIRQNMLQEIESLKQKVNNQNRQKQQLIGQINRLKLENQSNNNRLKQLQSQVSFYEHTCKVPIDSLENDTSLFKFSLQPIPIVKQRPRKNSVQEIQKIMSQIHQSESFIQNDPLDSIRVSYEKRIKGMKQDYQGQISKLSKQLKDLKESSRAYSTTMDSGTEKSLIFKDLMKKKEEQFQSMRQMNVKMREVG